MSSITTDSIKYHEEIKKRLTINDDSEWTPLWNYCEMTQLLIYGFSFTLLRKGSLQNLKLLYKEWDRELHFNNQFGIYNLNTIMIDKQEIDFSLKDILEIEELNKQDINTIDHKGIVLDGYHKEFTYFKINKKLIWNLDDEMNSDLAILVRKIKQLKN